MQRIGTNAGLAALMLVAGLVACGDDDNGGGNIGPNGEGKLTIILKDAPGDVQAGQPSEPSEVLDSFGRDALTGLPDRPGFVAKLDNALEAVQAGGAPRTLIYLTLRQMHSLTALGGEAMADRVRAGAAQALIDVLGPRDVAGRVGADEFALLLEGWNAETLPEQLAEIRAALGQYSMEVQGRTHRVDADIGAIPVNADSGDSLDVMSAADLACHRARVAARSGG